MMETLDRAEVQNPGSDVQNAGSPEATPARRQRRWSRAHTTWLLIALSLLPGMAAALSREGWAALPAGVRWSAYIASAILISVACTLIMRGEDKRGDS